jgi:hypothetical protein
MLTSQDTALAIEREVAQELPITAELREAWLGAIDDGAWSLRGQFQFGVG